MNIELKNKLYYNIGEVSKAFKVNSSLLRFWEKEFKELNPKKKSNGIRKYSQKDIDILKTIYHLLKVEKLTIEGAKKNLNSGSKEIKTDKEIVQKLINIKSELEKLNQDLLDLRLKHASMALKETHKISETKKDIARLKTKINMKIETND